MGKTCAPAAVHTSEQVDEPLSFEPLAAVLGQPSNFSAQCMIEGRLSAQDRSAHIFHSRYGFQGPRVGGFIHLPTSGPDLHSPGRQMRTQIVKKAYLYIFFR